MHEWKKHTKKFHGIDLNGHPVSEFKISAMPKVEHTDFYSQILKMRIKVEITGHYGFPVIMFPTAGGDYNQNSECLLNNSISNFTNKGILKLYNLETIDNKSFFAEYLSPLEKIYNYELYVQFLLQEYFHYIRQIHKTHRIALAGVGFGGYHAANFALRFPDLVSHLFCLSGHFSIRDFMEDYDDDLVYFNCPNEFIRNDAAWRFRHMEIVLSTSDQDICLNQTREMVGILDEKGIACRYDEAKWMEHGWPLWRMVFPKFIASAFGQLD